MSGAAGRSRHPVRGAVFGLLFGLLLGLDLVLFGVVSSNSPMIALLPVIGLLGGLALGLTIPLRPRRST
jgi:hypothetical protein